MPLTTEQATGATYRCRTCQQYLPLTEFYSATSYLGHQTECRACGMERRRQRVARQHELATSTSSYEAMLDSLTVNETRTFGVEIECYVPQTMSTVARKIREAVSSRCNAEGYNHHDGDHWKIVTDATVGDHRRNGTYYHGMEIVSPGGEWALKGKAGLREIAKVLAVVRNLGGIVDRHCGLHVHHAARDLDVAAWKRLYGMYAEFEDVFDSLMPPSRRGSNAYYCPGLHGRDRYYTRRLASSDWRWTEYTDLYAALDGATEVRDFAASFGRGKVNAESLTIHGTVEIRHHGGTLSFEKVGNWLALTQRLVEAAKTGIYAVPKSMADEESAPKGIEAMLAVAGASPAMCKFFRDRQASLNACAGTAAEPDEFYHTGNDAGY